VARGNLILNLTTENAEDTEKRTTNHRYTQIEDNSKAAPFIGAENIQSPPFLLISCNIHM
jgi:hypothetical protein